MTLVGLGLSISRRVAVGGAVLLLAFAVDRAAFAVLRSGLLYDHWGEMREGLTAAKFLGSGLGTAIVALVVGTLDRRRWRRALVLVLAATLAGAAAGGLKVLTGRERPSHLDQPVGGERLRFAGPGRGVDAPFQSFPSGHTTGAFASATCLSAFYPPARVVFYGVAVAAGANRVVKHQHFLSDVVAGALLGHLVALWLLSRPRLRRWWAPLPAPGAGVDSRSGPP